MSLKSPGSGVEALVLPPVMVLSGVVLGESIFKNMSGNPVKSEPKIKKRDRSLEDANSHMSHVLEQGGDGADKCLKYVKKAIEIAHDPDLEALEYVKRFMAHNGRDNVCRDTSGEGFEKCFGFVHNQVKVCLSELSK